MVQKGKGERKEETKRQDRETEMDEGKVKALGVNKCFSAVERLDSISFPSSPSHSLPLLLHALEQRKNVCKERQREQDRGHRK